jgi:hypothetical protein
MWNIFLLLIGIISGFLVRSLTMKVSFKQRTIENKIKVYDSIITHWVKMRNFIYFQLPNDPHSDRQFDIMYGESQGFIGEAILVSEDTELTEAINTLNEKFYRTNWANLTFERANEIMETIKKEAKPIVVRMREDIMDSTRFELKDLLHMLNIFQKKKLSKISIS